jgi:hypothetical protein
MGQLYLPNFEIQEIAIDTLVTKETSMYLHFLAEGNSQG